MLEITISESEKLLLERTKLLENNELKRKLCKNLE